jgi:tetratricopeptide (TPR) repeat protein
VRASQVGLWVALTSLFAASPGAAQEPTAPDAQSDASAEADALDEEGRGLFLAGQAAYNRARFDEALDYFERSYELSHRPQLLFNIGLAATRAGEPERARAAFEQYLEDFPSAPNRADVESRLRDLSAPSEEESGSSPLLGWIVVGASGAVAIAGAVFLALAAGAASTVEDPPENSTWASIEGDYDNANTFTIVGLVGAGVGVAGVALGIVLVASAGDEVAVAAGPTGVQVRGSF